MTLAQINKIRRACRTLRDGNPGLGYMQSLNLAAKSFGYADWTHLLLSSINVTP